MIQPKTTSFHSISSKNISSEKIKMTPLGKKVLDTTGSSANAKSTDGNIVTQRIPSGITFNKTASVGGLTTGLKKGRYDTQRTKASESTRISVSGSRTGIPMHPKIQRNGSKIGSGVLSQQQTPNLLSSSSIGQKYHS